MYRFFLVLFTFILLGCSSKSGNQFPSQEEERIIRPSEVEAYWIKFYKIDNQVKVLVNNRIIFDSGKGVEKKKEEVALGLSDELGKGKNIVKIELYNDIPYEGFMGFDKHWEVFYELFQEEVPIEYIHEQADDGQKGLVFEIKHEIVIS